MCFIKNVQNQQSPQSRWKALCLSFFFLTSIIALFFHIAVARAVQDEREFMVSSGNATAMEDDGGEYALGPGDILDIRVFGEPEVSATAIVRMDGRISLPLAGEVVVAGNTPELVGEQIKEKLERFIDAPNVVVMLTESRSKKYYILGQVKSPGEYDITRPVTVLQAIARAGGFGEWAKKDKIMIVAEPGEKETINMFNYDRFLRDADKKKNILIKPGDTIVVP